MDTANLESAARRYRDTEAALDAARADLQAEAVAFLQQHDERGSQAAAARITGWSREHIRNLWKKAEEEAERSRREAEVEELRRKVEELSSSKKPSPAAAPSRQQVTQSVPEHETVKDSVVSPQVLALPEGRVKELAEAAEGRHPEWVEQIRAAHPNADEHRMRYLIVEAGVREGFRLPAADPVSGEETTT